jgi:hypothetical protein
VDAVDINIVSFFVFWSFWWVLRSLSFEVHSYASQLGNSVFWLLERTSSKSNSNNSIDSEWLLGDFGSSMRLKLEECISRYRVRFRSASSDPSWSNWWGSMWRRWRRDSVTEWSSGFNAYT